MNNKDDELNIAVEVVDPEDEYRMWLSYAEDDFRAAEYLNSGPFHPKLYNIICYHYQQAAEKAAKGLIVYYKRPGGMAKVHDIDFQIRQIKNIVKDDKGIFVTDELLDIASDLSTYASEPRYPNEIPADAADVIKTRKYCVTIMEWVKKAIEAPSLKKEEKFGAEQ